jgi:trk system potassium uptake protein
VIVSARIRRATLGVEIGGALNLVGTLFKYLSLAFVLPVAVALRYGESVFPFVAAAGATAAAGVGLELATRGRTRVGTREGFLVVALIWLLAPASAALPYVLSGDDQLSRPLDAYFEAMAGFTTTGASVLTDIDAVDRSLLMWRQFSQWIGGIGIIVLALAVLPRLRIGGRQLFEWEAPGPEIEKLSTSIRRTARRIWILYVALTVLLLALLTAYGVTGVDDEMNFYTALAHAFTTIPTGGFSTEPRSVEGFSPTTQWTLALFIVLGGANFALMYAAFIQGRLRLLLRDEELRLYLGLLALGSLVLALELFAEDLASGEAAVRHAVFQTVSTMTTTGFASTDVNAWTPLAAVTLVGLMFFGGSAASTTGSIKVIRHLLIGRILRRELDQTVHPEVVAPIHYNGAVVNEQTLRAVFVFVLLYVGLFAVGALALVVDAARTDLALSPFEAVAVSAAMIGNVGPGFGFAGPMGSFEPFSDTSTVVMTLLMWLGRLEIIPVVVLLTRSYWRA